MDMNEQIQAITEAYKRRQTALNMRMAGKKLREIGDHFGVSREYARQMIAKATAENKPKET